MMLVAGCQTAVPFDSRSIEATPSSAPSSLVSPPEAATPSSQPDDNPPARPPLATREGTPTASWSSRVKRGRGHLKRGELTQAEDSFAAAYDQARGYNAGDPRTLATVRNLQRVSSAYLARGDSASFGRTMELLVFVSGEVTAARNLEFVRLLQELSATRTLQERPADARDALLLARSVQEEQRGSKDTALVGIHSQLGLAYIDLGDLDSAQLAIDLAAELAGQEDPPGALHAQMLVARAKLELARGNSNEARQALQSALDTSTEQFGAQHPETARIVREFALLEQQAGDNHSAQEHFDRAIAIWDSLPNEKRQQALSRNDLAWFLVETGQDAQAEAPARSAIELFEAASMDGQPLSAAADTLATSLRNQGKYIEAEPFYQLALEEGSKAKGLAGWNLSEMADRYAGLLEQTDRGSEAAELRLRWRTDTPATSPNEEP